MNLTELLSKVARDQGGFLRTDDIAQLARLDRLRKVLVRCGNCRFIIAAQEVDWIVGIITRENSDYVRDVSLLASDPAHNLNRAPKVTQKPRAHECATIAPLGSSTLGDYGGAFDGFSVSSDADSGL